jgi:Glycosyl transferase family 2
VAGKGSDGIRRAHDQRVSRTESADVIIARKRALGRLLPEATLVRIRRHRKNLRLNLRAIRTNIAWAMAMARSRPRPHGLPAALIVSVTSYPRRFKTLALTIKCLLSQSIAPDDVILWIADADKQALPNNVLALQRSGLTIEYTEDIGSYKKIIPALRRFPNAFIATADDDVYYWPTWLEELVNAYSPDRREILCHRVNRIRLGPDGLPLPYTNWDFEYDGSEASPLIFPTGVGGILYPPGHLHPDTVDDSTFRALCPSTDDAWLYCMGLRAGSQFRRTELGDLMARGGGSSSRMSMTPWPGSQEVSLWQSNVSQGGGNDQQLRTLFDRFGFPPTPVSEHPAGRSSGSRSTLRDARGCDVG